MSDTPATARYAIIAHVVHLVNRDYEEMARRALRRPSLAPARLRSLARTRFTYGVLRGERAARVRTGQPAAQRVCSARPARRMGLSPARRRLRCSVRADSRVCG